jgi:hypothetical protein
MEKLGSFEIGRGMRQGCLLAPYLFLLVGEALRVATCTALQAGDLSGILLPDGLTQQTLLQYADDTTYSLAGVECNIHSVTSLLSCFGTTTGLVYNPHKSVTYWFGVGAPPTWLQVFGCQVAVENHLSKLLGTPFGISLATQDIDGFLHQKILKKFTYWRKQFLSLPGRRVIINSILLSTLWFFIQIWTGSNLVIKKIRASLRDFLWSGANGTPIARVSWEDYCAAHDQWGLSFIDPEEALAALTSKWILRAFEPGGSALHILLRARIGQICPTSVGTWPPSLQWTLSFRFTTPRGSSI